VPSKVLETWQLPRPPDYRVESRWTPALTQGGFTPVSIFFLDNYHRLTPRLSYAEAMFLIHLLRFKWSDEAPFPSLIKIAQQMGISTQMARHHARHLEKNSYLKRELRFGETSRYDLQPLFTALEVLQKQGMNPALREDRPSEMARST
jgi:hypothetical protein